ncbi:MAG: fused MFS/spermidine synthase, partial [Planctomycetota bacterium]
MKAGILISGFCALAYEVFWSRMLSMVLGSSMYSFTLTVSTFLAGIALGSVIYARFLARVSRQTTVFIVLEFAIGVAAYLTPYTLLLAPRGATTGLLALLRSAALMAGPAVLMGAALPCAVSICRRGKALAGSSVGDVYAMNTVGSVVGPLAAGFVLIPVAGMQKGLLLVAGLNMLAGVMVFASRRMSRARRAACAAALVSLLAVTAILGPTTLFRHLYDRNEPGADVILYEEGAVANVVVYDFHRAGYRDLFLNGSEEASTRLWHIQLFRMLGALPAVVHGDPDDAVMIAFGAGMSAGACVDLVSNLECVELNPDIHEVAEIFARENLNVLRNPKLKLIVNDGRNHLLLTGKRYSLIMSDATNPVSFDAWTLYTREFYRLCKDRLEPGGVFCQWIPTHLPGEAVKTILKTFVSVFPHASVWSVYGSTQCLMLATPERLDIDYAKLRDSLPPVLEASGLAGCGVDTPEKFLSFFLVGEDGLRALLAGHEEINTDDLPRTQFLSGRDQEGTYSALELLRHQESIAPYVSNVGAEGERLRSRLRAYASLSRMLNLGFICADDFEFSKAAVLASEAGLAGDENLKNVLGCDRKRREYFVERIAGHPDDASAHRAMGFIHWKEGDHEKAVRELTRAIAIRSEFADAHLLLALVYIDMRMPDQATGKLLELKELNPTHGTLELLPKAFRAVHLLRKLKYQPEDPRPNASLAEAYAEFGWLEKAHGTVRLALERSPDDIGMLGRLAGIYETADLVEKALDAYRKLSMQLPGNRDVAARIERLADAVRTDEGWRRWVAAKHPARDDRARKRDDAGYQRAIKTWNEYEVEGRISEETLRRAAKDMAAIVAAGTEDPHVCEDAAVLHEILGRYDDAASFWRECRKLSPAGRDARNDRAGNHIERLELLARLRDAPPPKHERAGIHNQIGTLYWKNGEVETAIRSFEKALEEDPSHAIALANIGMCCIATGRY